jgi:ubiquinone/menaquinone biosynthesis C-methylase UbiE
MKMRFLEKLRLGPDGIYSSDGWGVGQEEEITLRRRVAEAVPPDLKGEIAIHHSFGVMDREVECFLDRLPANGVIIDVGGCWGWHWRNLHQQRPDATLVIIDLVKENLERAKYFLAGRINQSVFLVHGDGTKLPFDDNTFDAYWAVQALQHVPNLENALIESKRVLKPGGIFAMYNLNNPWAIRMIYKFLGKPWTDEGTVAGMFYLRRSGSWDGSAIKRIFGNVSPSRYTEIIFTPELNWHKSAAVGHWLGKLDSWLSSGFCAWNLIARQRSYSAVKQKDL